MLGGPFHMGRGKGLVRAILFTLGAFFLGAWSDFPDHLDLGVPVFAISGLVHLGYRVRDVFNPVSLHELPDTHLAFDENGIDVSLVVLTRNKGTDIKSLEEEGAILSFIHEDSGCSESTPIKVTFMDHVVEV